MGKMNIRLSDELEARFREEVFKRLGMKKGNISNAVNEAVELWIEKGRKRKEEKKSD